MMIRPLLSALLLSTATPLLADVPKVATDIAPVHGLVARVMDGVGSPTLIIDPSASPHHYAMRPSEARALQEADIVIWVGEELTPWFEDRIETLAPEARSVDLIHAPGTVLLDVREEMIFAAAEDHDDHGHDEHDEHDEHDHGHDEDKAHSDDHGHEDDHAEAHDDHGHSHEGTDPHAWLMVENARVWTRLIADALAKADPDNAATYASNAEAAIAELDALEAEVKADLAIENAPNFIVFHDAYQYFEQGMGISAVAALSGSDAADPGPAHIRAMQDLIETENVGCAFAEPQFDTRRLDTVLGGTDAKTGVLDPIGRDIPLGTAFYPTLIRSLGASMAACLKG